MSSLRYTDYDRNTNDDRSELTGNSALRAQLVPQRLFWAFSHTLSEDRSNRSDTDTADNRERRQQISTGPQLLYSITDADSLGLTALYQ